MSAPADLAREIERLEKVNRALMDRAERDLEGDGSEFGLFQTTLVLEAQVRERTVELQQALQLNERVNQDLARANESQRSLIAQLADARGMLVLSERMAAVGQLASGVAHEINNPMAFISSNLETAGTYAARLFKLLDAYLAAEPPGSSLAQARHDADLDFIRADLPQLLQESMAGVQRVKRIVSSLREFAQAGASDRWAKTDLNEALVRTLEVLADTLRRHAEVRHEPGELPLVDCQAGQMNQVFLTLLLNAAQASPRSGVITIRSGQAGDEVWVSVSDTGKGIAPENLGRIFEPFFTTHAPGQGPGLGLAVAYGVVQRHHGRIEVQSTPGQGSCFTVWLPIRQGPVSE